MRSPTLLLAAAWVLAASIGPARGEDLREKVGIDQLLGAQVPADVSFKDDSGAEVRVGRYFGPRPIVLSFVYFDCPMLCNEVLNAESRMFNGMGLTIGKDFDVLTVSIDPKDTPDKARLRKARYLERYGRPGAGSGWHFLTGSEESSLKLARSVGFRYTYTPATRQYVHAAGIMILTPEGKVSRYFQGISYPPRDVRYALTEARSGKLGAISDQVMLFCYQYDPATGRYTLAILNIVRVLGTGTAIALGLFILRSWRKDRTKATAAAPTPSTA